MGWIEPHYPHAGKGRPPHDLERVLRINFLQQGFNLSDPPAEDATYDSEPMRRFARVERGDHKVPDESTILRFRHRLERHGLLREHQLTLRAGTLVGATKHATGTRDPELKQTRKRKNWHFGVKLHIGTDRRGIVHSLTATHATEADIKQLPQLLHGEESALYGDPAYRKQADREAFEAQGVRYRVNRRAFGGPRKRSERWRKINRARSRARAGCEHPFRVIQVLWGFEKVRYRGITKNLARAQTLFALANRYAVHRRLLPPETECAL